MSGYRRYAVFFAPPSGSALARFGAAWLGWDAEAAAAVAHPAIAGLPAPVADLTATPRRYGFHGTLKPPFRLVDGADRATVSRVLARLAERLAPIEAAPLALRALGRFAALVPSRPDPGLAGLAAACVRALDHLRAPPDEAELARRRRAGLSPAQEANLGRWGYPYVMADFRFHLTLTGALEADALAQVLAALEAPTAPFRQAALPVTEICLFGEPERGFFRLIERHRLTG